MPTSPSSEHLEDVKQNPDLPPLYLDPASGEPRAGYMASEELMARCAQFGHVEKTKYSTLSESIKLSTRPAFVADSRQVSWQQLSFSPGGSFACLGLVLSTASDVGWFSELHVNV